MHRTMLFVFMIILLGSDGAYAAKCRPIGQFHLAGESDYPMSFNVASGVTCDGTFGSFGAVNISFKRLFLASAPARGKIKLREGGTYIYAAPANKGTDAFKLRVCGSENDKPGCATLHFSVTVN